MGIIKREMTYTEQNKSELFLVSLGWEKIENQWVHKKLAKMTGRREHKHKELLVSLREAIMIEAAIKHGREQRIIELRDNLQ